MQRAKQKKDSYGFFSSLKREYEIGVKGKGCQGPGRYGIYTYRVTIYHWPDKIKLYIDTFAYIMSVQIDLDHFCLGASSLVALSCTEILRRLVMDANNYHTQKSSV